MVEGSANDVLGKSQLYVGLEKCIGVMREGTIVPDLKLNSTYTQASAAYKFSYISRLSKALACQNGAVHRKRFLIDRKEHSLDLLNLTAIDVQLLSIHTGTKKENHWHKMNFSETEPLLLHQVNTFFPTSGVHKERKISHGIQLLYEEGNNKKSRNLVFFHLMIQLKSVRLEKLFASPVLNQRKMQSNFEKVPSILCEGFESVPTFNSVGYEIITCITTAIWRIGPLVSVICPLLR
ncbi:hypothetical protein SUGI_0362110, partial [Cryptomeria japonica]